MNISRLSIVGVIALSLTAGVGTPSFAAKANPSATQQSAPPPSPYWYSDSSGSQRSTEPLTGVRPQFSGSAGASYCNGNVSIPKKSGSTLRATSSQTCSAGVTQVLKGQIIGLDYYNNPSDFGNTSSVRGVGGTISMIMSDNCGSAFKYYAKVNVQNTYTNGAKTNDDYYSNTVTGVC